MAEVQDERTFALGVDHLEADAIGRELAGVADLATALGVEGGLVEHDGDGLGVPDFVDQVAQLVLGNDAHDAGLEFTDVVAAELGAVHGLFQGIERARLEELDLLAASGFDAMPLHGLRDSQPSRT